MSMAASGPEAVGPALVDTVVAGGWVLTMNPGREVYRAGAIAIRDGLIVEVGQRADILGRYTAARLIDAPDGVIIPGLVNGHRHLLCCAKGAMPEGGQTLNALRSFIYPSFAAITEDDMHVFARHAAAEMIRFGTTLFEEPGCNHLDAVLEALAESGIRARTGPWTWDQAGPAGDTDLPGWLRFDAKTALRRLENGIETVRKFGHPRITDAVTIEGVGTASDELTRGAAELALEAESLFVVHKSTSEREVELELAVYGERPVAHMAAIGALNERTLLNHMTSLDDNDVALVAAAGARISQNPSSALKLAKGTTQTGKWPELLAAGVPMALGTDAENVSNHTDICRAMQLAALLPRDARRDPRAVTAEQAVEMATIGGATALLLHNDVGSLEPGKQADLVVFDTSDFDWRPLHNPVANLVYGSTGHSVDTVLIGGDVLLAGKKLTTLDEDQLREDVERVNRRILREIGIDPAPAWPVLLAGISVSVLENAEHAGVVVTENSLELFHANGRGANPVGELVHRQQLVLQSDRVVQEPRVVRAEEQFLQRHEGLLRVHQEAEQLLGGRGRNVIRQFGVKVRVLSQHEQRLVHPRQTDVRDRQPQVTEVPSGRVEQRRPRVFHPRVDPGGPRLVHHHRNAQFAGLLEDREREHRVGGGPVLVHRV
jgi:5-methylthioadenosine/S-adenosylhomocysteine deaminase